MNAITAEMADNYIPPASITGRILKIVVGGYQVYFALLATSLFARANDTLPADQPSFWVIAGLGIYFAPWAVKLGFYKILRISRASLFAVIAGGALAAATWGFVQYQSVWAPVLSGYLIAIAIYAHAHIGISNMLAAVVGIRGCEMRVIPYLYTRTFGDRTELVECPGVWTPIDRWEARLRNRI